MSEPEHRSTTPPEDDRLLLDTLLEKACRAQLIAQAAGAFTWTADKEALRKRAHIYTPQAIQQIWNYHRRRLAPKAPEAYMST